MSKTLLYIGAGILFLIGLILIVFSGFAFIGSTDPVSGQANWVNLGLILGCFGVILFGGGAGLIYLAMRGQKTEIVQQVTMNVDLPGDTQIEELKCRSCGGVLSANDIKLVNGAPMVNCPYCNTVYQLTEEPKW
jgi:phage FluMu protein Com